MEISLNEYLKGIRKEYELSSSNFTKEWQRSFEDNDLDGKVRFIRQWLDLSERLNNSTYINWQEKRSILNVLRNIAFIQKLRGQFQLWHEEAEDELYNLRFLTLCRELERVNIRLTGSSVKLMPINDINVIQNLQKFNTLENQTIHIDVKQFGIDLNARVQMEAISILNDFLLFIKHSLEEIVRDEKRKLDNEENVMDYPCINPNEMEQQNTMECANNTEKLLKIVNDIDKLLENNDYDLHAKREIIYQYIQENRTLDENNQFIQEIDNDGNKSLANSNFIDQIFYKLQTKGLQLMRIFLFSNLEFLELLHRHWMELLPQAPLAFFLHRDHREAVGGHLLRDVQIRYENFRRDFINTNIYNEYLETVRRLYEASKDNGNDPTHIFEMMYSASENIATLREDIMMAKCREMLMLMK